MYGPWSSSHADDIDIDFVSPNEDRSADDKLPKPGADSDAGNIAIDFNGQLVKKVKAGGSVIPLMTIIENCTRKQFIFFYNLKTDLDMARGRLKKYLERGWVLVGFCSKNGHDGHDYRYLLQIVREIDPVKYEKYVSQIKPKQEYCRDWENFSA